MKRFSDFSTENRVITGDKIKINDVLDKEIIIKSFRVNDSRYKDGKVLTLQFDLNDKEYIIFTGSKVLIEQCEKYKDEMPFIAKIEKVNKFYTFT